MRRLINKLIITLFFTLAFLATVSAETLDNIVAVVNDSVITQSQLNQEIDFYRQQMQMAHAPTPAPAVLRKEVLNHMIDMQLQIDFAKKQGVKVDDAELNQAITRIAQQNGLTLAQMQDQLTKQGMDFNKYREEIRSQIIVSQLQQRAVGPQVKVSDQDVTDFLRQGGERLLTAKPDASAGGPTVYHLQDVLIPFPDNATPEQMNQTLQEAQDALNKLRSGQTINVQIGDLGWRPLNDVPDIFVATVKTLKPGQISEPVKADNGYHLIRLLEMRGGAATMGPQATPYVTHVRHILIKTNPLTSDEAVKIRLFHMRDAIQNGLDTFEDMAKKNSQDPGSASKGGDLGWVNPGMLDPAFETAMNQLKINQISDPVKSAFGWHLIQVLERKDIASNKEFLQNQARQLLYQRKFNEAVQNWVQQLRSQSYVKIM